MRGKTCGGYNTSVVNYATAVMHGKACGGCSTSAGNYATVTLRGKNCDGCKRGGTQLMLSAGYTQTADANIRSVSGVGSALLP